MLDAAQLQVVCKAFGHVPFTAEMQQHFSGIWQQKTVKKRQLITEAGQVERCFYVVLQGVQAVYVIDSKGQQVVLGFSFTGSVSGIYDSFLNATPSHFFLEALTDSTLLYITAAQYHELFERFPVFSRWGMLFAQSILNGRVQREVELLTMNAKERYITFMRRCPAALKTIPQKYLAAYLNLKPETFSRLRATVQY